VRCLRKNEKANDTNPGRTERIRAREKSPSATKTKKMTIRSNFKKKTRRKKEKKRRTKRRKERNRWPRWRWKPLSLRPPAKPSRRNPENARKPHDQKKSRDLLYVANIYCDSFPLCWRSVERRRGVYRNRLGIWRKKISKGFLCIGYAWSLCFFSCWVSVHFFIQPFFYTAAWRVRIRSKTIPFCCRSYTLIRPPFWF